MQHDRYRTIRYCAYALLLVACFVFQSARGTAIRLLGSNADLLPFALACIALFEGPYVAGSFGFAAGLMASVHSPAIEGVSALYFGLFGVAFGILGAMYMRKVLAAALLGGSLCIVVHGVLRYIFYYRLIYGMGLYDGAVGLAAELGLSILPGILIFYIVRALNRRFTQAEA